MTDKDSTDLIRARQRSRARIMGVLLAVFVVLVFAISIVKIAQGYGP
jgi:predicted tellurium resistance membrane protein TerC